MKTDQLDEAVIVSKAEQLKAEVEADKKERLSKFLEVIQKAEQDFRCGLSARTIIQGDKVMQQVFPFAND